MQIQQRAQDGASALKFLCNLWVRHGLEQVIKLCIERLFLFLQGLAARDSDVSEKPATQGVKRLTQDLVRLADCPESFFPLLSHRGAKFMNEPSLAYATFP